MRPKGPPARFVRPKQTPTTTAQQRAEVDAALAVKEALQAHQAGQLQTAEACYCRALAIQPNHPDALHLLGFLFYQRGQGEMAVEWISRALAVKPNTPPFLSNLGIVYSSLGRQEEAVTCYRKVLQIQPDYYGAINNLGNILAERGQREEAIVYYRKALAIKSDDCDVLSSLGNALLGKGEYTEAIACYQKILTIQPHYANAYTGMGTALRDLKQLAESVTYYRKGLALHPNDCNMLNGLGTVLLAQGKISEAMACHQQAIHIQPNHSTAYHNMGNALCNQGKLTEAAGYLQKALSIDPNMYQSHTGLGNVFQLQGKLAEAILCYQRVLDLRPDDVHTLCNLAYILSNQKKLDESVAYYRKAADLAPDNPETQCSLLHQMLASSDWEGYDAHYKRMITAFHEKQKEGNPFVFLTLPTSPAEQKHCTEWYVANKYPTRDNLAATRHYAADPDRLKIGYLSFDYQNHPCGYVAAELFAHHDRRRVEVIAYSYSTDDGGEVRKRILANSDRFVDLHPLAHEAAARRICDDGVHILVDLTGLTKGSRAEIPALRPAPIQASWLGGLSTMGAPFFDYCITDYFLAPPGAEAHFSEKLIRLPWYFQPRRPAADTTPTRQACNLPEAGFVFVCFNQPYKINPPLFAVWMRLLNKVPGSVLWFKAFNKWSEANLRREAENRGVDGSRLFFAGYTPSLADHIARYRVADLALDTYPYPSGSTGWDALSAGCPIVSCVGQGSMSRAAGSQLVHVGMPDLITYSLEEYEQLALALVNDPVRLASIQKRLLENVPTARLFDAARFARHLEEAYQAIWQRFQSGQTPDHIHIAPAESVD